MAVAAAGGLGCEAPPLPSCGARGRCVGRTQGQPSDSRTCACDSGWSGSGCDSGDPCAGVDCKAEVPHSTGVCLPNRDGLSHTCPCSVGWQGESCDSCESGYIGEHCAAAFALSGASGNFSNLTNGRYERLAWPEHQCNHAPVYQRGGAGGGGAVLYWASVWWVGPPTRLGDCEFDRSGAYLNSHCSANPDGEGCVGHWAERAVPGCAAPNSDGYCDAPAVAVAAAGGDG